MSDHGERKARAHPPSLVDDSEAAQRRLRTDRRDCPRCGHELMDVPDECPVCGPVAELIEQPSDRDRRYLDLAAHVAGWSKDRSTRVGCVIIGPAHEIRSIGYNGFPRGVIDELPERHERPTKYLWTEHAERNAIYNAARMGTPLVGCAMYLPWFPCADCARAIVQAGIAQLVCHPIDFTDERWREHFLVARAMLNEGRVAVRLVAR